MTGSVVEPTDLEIGFALQFFEKLFGGRGEPIDREHMRRDDEGYRFGSRWCADSKFKYGTNLLGEENVFYVEANLSGAQRHDVVLQRLCEKVSNCFGDVQKAMFAYGATNSLTDIAEAQIRVNDFVREVHFTHNRDSTVSQIQVALHEVEKYASAKPQSDRFAMPLAFFDSYVLELMGLQALSKKLHAYTVSHSASARDDERLDASSFLLDMSAIPVCVSYDMTKHIVPLLSRSRARFTFESRYELVHPKQTLDYLPNYEHSRDILEEQSISRIGGFCASARKHNDRWTSFVKTNLG